MSDGPYQVSSYVPNKSIVLTRNPAWKQATDPLRHQYVTKVVVTLGTSSDQTVLTDLQAGSQDLFLADLNIPPQNIASLQASNDKRLRIWPSSNLNPYIILNLRSPNSGGAMKKLAVRQAIQFAVNKSAVVKVNGGPAINKVLTSAIGPGNIGYQPYTKYATPDNEGNPAGASRCWPAPATHGLTLATCTRTTAATPPSSSPSRAAWPGAASAQRHAEAERRRLLHRPGNTPQTSKPGTWDMATGSWFPDWFGNNGRTLIQPLFQTNCSLGTVNAGCCSSPTVDKLISQALKSSVAVGRRRRCGARRT